MKPTITRSLLITEEQPFSHVKPFTIKEIINSDIFGELGENMSNSSFIFKDNVDLVVKASTELLERLVADPEKNKKRARIIANKYCSRYKIDTTNAKFANIILTVCIISIIYNVVEDARWRAYFLADCLNLNGYSLEDSLELLELDPKCVKRHAGNTIVELEGVHVLIEDGETTVVTEPIDYSYLHKIKKVIA